MTQPDPTLPAAPDTSTPEGATRETFAPSGTERGGLTRAGAVWVATGVSLVLLIVLIVFILQNQASVNLKFLSISGHVPVGVAMLIAAVVGGALVAVAGAARVVQLRRALHRTV